MNNKKKYESGKTPLSSKIFLGIFVLVALIFTAYSIGLTENLKEIINGIIAIILFIAFIVPIFILAIRIGRQKITEKEQYYITDLESIENIKKIVEGITTILRKILGANITPTTIFHLIVVIGAYFKWFFFCIFLLVGVVPHFYGTAYNIPLIFYLLIIIWFPPLESLFLKIVDYKLIFSIKVIITILIAIFTLSI